MGVTQGTFGLTVPVGRPGRTRPRAETWEVRGRGNARTQGTCTEGDLPSCTEPFVGSASVSSSDPTSKPPQDKGTIDDIVPFVSRTRGRCGEGVGTRHKTHSPRRLGPFFRFKPQTRSGNQAPFPLLSRLVLVKEERRVTIQKYSGIADHINA